jgi:hypothetical protein
VIIDEMVKEVTQYTMDIEAVARAMKVVNGDENAPPEAIEALDKLHSFIVDRAQQRTPIDRLSDQAVQELVRAIGWFTTKAAGYFADSREGVATLFRFARCLSKGWAFICTDGGATTLTRSRNISRQPTTS